MLVGSGLTNKKNILKMVRTAINTTFTNDIIIRKSGSLEANYEEMWSGSRYLHSTKNVLAYYYWF